MTHTEKAREYRRKIEQAAGHMPDNEAFSSADLFPLWAVESISYVTGNRVRFGDTLYKCVQTHTSQAGWTPTAAPSLWARIDDPAIEWPAWVQPTGANPYPMGAKVTHKGKKWISIHSANVWEPGVSQWNEVV